MKVGRSVNGAEILQNATGHGPNVMSKGSEVEHIRWDPKDSELFLGRRKPGENLVDVRSSVDVQIACQIWVKGRKTHRAIW